MSPQQVAGSLRFGLPNPWNWREKSDTFMNSSLSTASFTNPPNGRLLGRWQKRLPSDMVGINTFRSDSPYNPLIDGKVFSSGKYYGRQDTLSDSNGTRGLAYYSTYKFNYFAEDSDLLMVIRDIGRGRRNGYDGLTIGRRKPKKP